GRASSRRFSAEGAISLRARLVRSLALPSRMVVPALAMAAALIIALGWRHAWAPAAGAAVAVGIALAGGVVRSDDVTLAARGLWRPLVTILGLMATTSCAA